MTRLATIAGIVVSIMAIAGGLYSASDMVVWSADYRQDKIRNELRWNDYERYRVMDQYIQLKNLRHRTPREQRWKDETEMRLKFLDEQRKLLEQKRD